MGAAPPAVWPRPLSAGARVALVAPGGPIDPERIELARNRCMELGLAPVLGANVSRKLGFLAGPDDGRLADLQVAFDDPSIDGIWALRGGYGALRLVDRLDIGRQTRDPIPFIGFSDNTVIHMAHARAGVVSFHGPHPAADFPPETRDSLVSLTFGTEEGVMLHARPTDPPPTTLLPGRAAAPLYGGNLAILASLCGSDLAPRAAGKILFLEDVSEPAYRTDRMLRQLERAGAFAGVQGLAIGRFTHDSDEECKAIRTVLSEFADRLCVPAVVDLPFGHVEHNSTLAVGGWAELDAEEGELRICRDHRPADQGGNP